MSTVSPADMGDIPSGNSSSKIDNTSSKLDSVEAGGGGGVEGGLVFDSSLSQQLPCPSTPLLVWKKKRLGSHLRLVDSVLRVFNVAFCLVSLSSMVTSNQRGLIYFFSLPFSISIHFTSIRSFRYLVVALAIAVAYSVTILLLRVIQALKKASRSPPLSPTAAKFFWLLCSLDQVNAYLVISAAAAASGTTSVNKLGLNSMNLLLPDLCESMDEFCKRVTISIIFAMFASLTSASSAALDVYALCSGLSCP